jgi:hypothetical protein
MFKWLREMVLDNFVKSYLSDLIKRLDGYKFFLGLTLTLLQIGEKLYGKDLPILNTIIEALNGHGGFEAILQPNDIGILATSLLAVYGLIMKGVKRYKGVPQVPSLILPK